jgi:hypothetical protein
MDKADAQLGIYAAELAKYCADCFVDEKLVPYDEPDNLCARHLDPLDPDDYALLSKINLSDHPYDYEGVKYPEKVVRVHQGTAEDVTRYAGASVYPEDLKLMVEVEIAATEATRLRELLDGRMFNLMSRREMIGCDLYVVHRLPLISTEVDATAPQTMTIVVKHLTA